MPDPSSHQIALACGTAGAYVDVSAYVLSSYSINRTSWRTSQFEDARPGTFSFVLDNSDGRFTPDNPAAILSTTVSEGMGVSWKIGSRVVAGKIRSITPRFGSTDATSAEMAFVCDDSLGDLARAQVVGSLANAAVYGSGAHYFWDLEDSASALWGTERVSGATPLVLASASSATVTTQFGVAGITGVSTSQVEIVTPASSTGFFQTVSPFLTNTFTHTSTGVVECFGFMATMMFVGSRLTASFVLRGLSSSPGFSIFADLSGLGRVVVGAGTTNVILAAPVLQAGVPYYFQMQVSNTSSTAITCNYYLNGALLGTVTWAGVGSLVSDSDKSPTTVQFQTSDGVSASTIRLSHISLGPALVNESAAMLSTETDRATLIAQVAPGVTLTPPTGLSAAAIGVDEGNETALDAMNDVVRSEQGYLYTATSGTLTAPVQTVVARARTRSTTITATFSVRDDIADPTDFLRSLSDTAFQTVVTGTSQSVTVTNTALRTRSGNKSTTDSVLLDASLDLTAWGQDRLIRGAPSGLTITSFQVEAQFTTSDRWSALTALAPGDTIRVSDLPVTQLGISTWDAYFLGADESHSEDSHLFTLYVAWALPATGIYDTDLYANGGNNTISTTLTSGATSMKCTSADVVTLFETSAVNYYLQVDSEVVKVTACSAPVAGVQTLTITRAQFSTAAAAHAIGVVPEVYADSTGRLNNGIYAF